MEINGWPEDHCTSEPKYRHGRTSPFNHIDISDNECSQSEGNNSFIARNDINSDCDSTQSNRGSLVYTKNLDGFFIQAVAPRGSVGSSLGNSLKHDLMSVYVANAPSIADQIRHGHQVNGGHMVSLLRANMLL
jgi:hypothetical protein